MKIFLTSDLHVEFRQSPDIPAEDVDLVVLAGDIHQSTLAVRVAEQFRDQLDAPVVLIAGNHEYYHGEYHHVLADLRSDAAGCRDIHFLEKDSVIFGNVRFLGCTFWPNFSLYEEIMDLSKTEAGQYINDFRLIRYGDRSISPNDMIDLHHESYDWLQRELKKEVVEKTVVVTHFSPHPAAIHPQFLSRRKMVLTPYFTQDCSQLIRSHAIDIWMYGHTHNSVDVIVEGKTRLISNQKGYPGEAPGYTQYKPDKIIEI